MVIAKPPTFNAQIREQAAEWFVDFRTGDVDDSQRRAFSDWLRRGPEYVQAYLEIAAVWNEGAKLDSKRHYGEEELIALARTEDNVVALPAAGHKPVPPAPIPPHAATFRSPRRWVNAAAVLVAAISIITWMQLNRDVFSTAIGEQRSLALADGSTVQLNSRSRIRIRYTEDERAIDLLEGQALFNVAKDVARAFVVQSDTTQVRAVGTQFDVYRRTEGTTVTVLEGRVAVQMQYPAGGAAPVADVVKAQTARARGSSGKGPIVLSAGEQITIAPMAPVESVEPVKTDVAIATAWTQRRLVFDSASLAEVAEEFNRYNTRQIVLKDADVVDFHISGVFSSSDPGALIRFLRERSGIKVVETASEIQISRS